jgi:hypothetical protein
VTDKRKVARDAKDGQFVSAEEAAANPDETVVETIEFERAESTDEQLSEQDIADLRALGVEPNQGASFHPILKVWSAVLEPAKAESLKSPSPQWSTKILGSYMGLKFADMLDVRDIYFDLIDEMLDIIKAEIDTDPDCLTYGSAEEDVENNSGHYRNLITNWQVAFLRHELAWDCASPTAAAQIAGMNEAHKMFFGDLGLTQHLDNIRFEFTEADQAAMRAALDEVLATREGDGE